MLTWSTWHWLSANVFVVLLTLHTLTIYLFITHGLSFWWFVKLISLKFQYCNFWHRRKTSKEAITFKWYYHIPTHFAVSIWKKRKTVTGRKKKEKNWDDLVTINWNTYQLGVPPFGLSTELQSRRIFRRSTLWPMGWKELWKIHWSFSSFLRHMTLFNISNHFSTTQHISKMRCNVFFSSIYWFRVGGGGGGNSGASNGKNAHQLDSLSTCHMLHFRPLHEETGQENGVFFLFTFLGWHTHMGDVTALLHVEPTDRRPTNYHRSLASLTLTSNCARRYLKH